MTRRTAEERFADIDPPGQWPPTGEAVAATVAALVHPSRRMLLDHLTTRGPASVGRLARATGLAPGSVSHHIRVLARVGLVQAAPELAGDTRESWWRHVPRSLSWNTAAFGSGPAAEQLGRAASDANLSYLLARVNAWRSAGPTPGWDALVTDALVTATSAELDDLSERMTALIGEWRRGCLERTHAQDAENATVEPRRPVRVIAVAFPDAEPRP